MCDVEVVGVASGLELLGSGQAQGVDGNQRGDEGHENGAHSAHEEMDQIRRILRTDRRGQKRPRPEGRGQGTREDGSEATETGGR